MMVKKLVDCFLRSIEDEANVVVASFPGVLEDSPAELLKDRHEAVAQPIHGLANRSAPPLVPAAVHAGVASAVASPALDAVGATPRTVFENLHFFGRGMPFEEFG